MDIQSNYQKAIKYAGLKHAETNQTIPDSIIPYAVHLSNVAMEILIAGSQTKDFNFELAIQVALLHDVLEDTPTTFAEIEEQFGKGVAEGVFALTKDKSLSKDVRMKDCLYRLKFLPHEVQAIKLADRITNLQIPPKSWGNDKIKNYLLESELILSSLMGCNSYLENRLYLKIVEYRKYTQMQYNSN